MTQTRIYPLVIKFDTKDVQVGMVKIEFDDGRVINSYQQEHEAILKDIQINYKKGDIITKVTGTW